MMYVSIEIHVFAKENEPPYSVGPSSYDLLCQHIEVFKPMQRTNACRKMKQECYHTLLGSSTVCHKSFVYHIACRAFPFS